MDIPRFKKKVNSYLLCEEGKISKQAIVAVGGIAAALALGSLASKSALAGTKTNCESSHSNSGPSHFECWGHNNGANPQDNGGNAVNVQHQHHYNHGSHTSHGSHSSHSSGGGGGGCVLPGAKILMSDKKTKLAKDIKKGDKILSYNTKTKKNFINTIKKVYPGEFERYYEIALENGMTLKLSKLHPVATLHNGKVRLSATDYGQGVRFVVKRFFTKPLEIFKNLKWMHIGLTRYCSLKIGQEVILEDEKTSRIKEITTIKEKTTMYNYTMENNNNPLFYVDGCLTEGLNNETKDYIKWLVDSKTYK